LGDILVGVQCVANYTWMDSPGPDHQRFIDAYKNISNGELLPGMYAANTYIATRMLVAAIEKAGDPDPEKVIPALESLDFKSPWSTVRFRKEDHQAMTKAYIAEVVKTDQSPYGVALKPTFTAEGAKITPPRADTR